MNRAFRELQRAEWRVFVALTQSASPASARDVGQALEELGFELNANAIRDHLAKCVAKGYARAVAPPATSADKRGRGRPAALYFEPARELRPAVVEQFRRWLEEWVIPQENRVCLVDALEGKRERAVGIPAESERRVWLKSSSSRPEL